MLATDKTSYISEAHAIQEPQSLSTTQQDGVWSSKVSAPGADGLIAVAC